MLWSVPLRSRGLHQFIGQPFARLAMHLLQSDATALGLYRSSQSANSRDRLPFVYCAPKYDLELRGDDCVFVLAGSAWAEDHDPEFESVMRERAALCLQAHWRGFTARRRVGRRGFRSKLLAQAQGAGML